LGFEKTKIASPNIQRNNQPTSFEWMDGDQWASQGEGCYFGAAFLLDFGVVVGVDVVVVVSLFRLELRFRLVGE